MTETASSLAGQVRGVALAALQVALARAPLNAGDTLTITVPLPASTYARPAALRLLLDVLRDVGHETGFSVGYTAGASSFTLTRSNMPASHASTPTAADIAPLLQQYARLQEQLLDLQISGLKLVEPTDNDAKLRQTDRPTFSPTDWIALCTLLFMVITYVIDKVVAPHG